MKTRTYVALGVTLSLTAFGCVEEETPDAPSTLVTQQQALGSSAPPAADCVAQSTFAQNLGTPIRIELTPRRNLLVAEGGSFAAPNQGVVSRLAKDGSGRLELVGGLPSAISTDQVPSGPSGIVRIGAKRLYIITGRGDVTQSPFPGGPETVNPNPSSQLFSALIRVDFSKRMDNITEGFALTQADRDDLKAGKKVRITNSNHARATFKLIADVPDIENIPGKGDVPTSPLGLAILPFKKKAVYTDSSKNTLEEIDLKTGAVTRLVSFPEVANPLFDPSNPFTGGPTVEAVPTSVRNYFGSYLVSLETGFPFGPGVASIEAVNRRTLAQSTFVGGLTQVIDAVPVVRFGPDSFYAVELSSNLLQQPFPAPGRVLRFDSNSTDAIVLSDTVNGPSGVAYDRFSKTVYATETFTGSIVAIDEACALSK